MKRLYFFLALCLLCLVPCLVGGDGLYKPWDTHAAAITAVLHGTVPAPFLPVGKAVSIQTVSKEEAHEAIAFIYHEDFDVSGLLVLYLPRSSDEVPNLPEHGSLILIVGKQEPKEARYTVCHEYGHWVYFELLTEDERALWHLMWQTEHQLGIHPTRYAGSNEWEGFAETFAAYCYNAPPLTARSRDLLDQVAARLQPGYRRDRVVVVREQPRVRGEFNCLKPVPGR